MENFHFAKKHRFYAENMKIMPAWLPAWKTLVNSASSSNGKQTEGILPAVLPRERSDLTPCVPRVSAAAPGAPTPAPPHSASPQLFGSGEAEWSRLPLQVLLGCTWETDPKACLGTRAKSSLHRAGAALLTDLTSSKRIILFISSQIQSSFIYLLLRARSHFHNCSAAEVSIFLTQLRLLSTILFRGNSFNFQDS